MKKIAYLFMFLMTASCVNILQDTANKTTDEARLYQARMHLAKGEWSLAIAQFNLLSTATQSDPYVLIDMASAYSGRCGLDFITIASNLNGYSGASRFFEMILPIVSTSTASYADCVTSETILKTLASDGVVVDYPVGKFLMAFNSIAKMSAILNFYADTDEDGIVDATWDPCNAGGLVDLPNADLDEIVTGFFLFINNIAGLSVGENLPDFLTQCEGVLGSGNCSVVDTGSVTNTQRWFMRAAISETDDNIGFAITSGNIATILAGLTCNL